MICILKCFPNVSVKHWCVFLSSFTVVMVILIFSTDLKNRHNIHFNSSYIWDFEECNQESPRLIHLIRSEFIQPPVTVNSSMVAHSIDRFPRKLKPSLQLLKIFRRKRSGIYLELGANRNIDEPASDTEWLSSQLQWHGLITQPNPDLYRAILSSASPRTHTAQVCISPTIYVKHALFKVGGDLSNSSLIPVPCFPLYSLIRAYNTSYLDLLLLNKVNAPLQVLKTIPLSQIRVKTVGLVNHGLNELEDLASKNVDLCCADDLVQILEERGYKRTFDCPSLAGISRNCYFVCANQGGRCPSKQRH